MLTKEENESLTCVGPGTPAEKCCVATGTRSHSSRVEKPADRRRILGEDLVLFRDEQNRLGLLALRCSHRGTSLEFGHLEDGGLRCCYHGWLYDVEGRVLEMPGEPVDSTFGQRVRHPAYKVQELGGVVFRLSWTPTGLALAALGRAGAGGRSASAASADRELQLFQMIENSVDQKSLDAGCIEPPQRQRGKTARSTRKFSNMAF